MAKLSTLFFPLPLLSEGERKAGYRFSWPIQCTRCDRQCETRKNKEVAACTYGVNYIWLSDEALSFGFLVRRPNVSAAQKKAFQQNPNNILTNSELASIVDRYRKMAGDIEKELQEHKNSIISEYVQRREYEGDFLKLIRPDLQRNLAYLHDYKQFIARVRQNINVVIESRNAGESFDERFDRALPSEKAIYYAAILMEEKLRIAWLLMNPEQLLGTELRLFRLHGLVTKYLRIYSSSYDEKKIDLKTRGESRGSILGDPAAVGVIPHTLIDNALKYSLRGAEVIVSFEEDSENIVLRVSSFGPKIEKEEMSKIFQIFYRSKGAVQQEEEGAGFGLYLAQLVAAKVGTRIEVEQKPNKTPKGYLTTFSVKFRREI
jgi:signal transduction histidine kinase